MKNVIITVSGGVAEIAFSDEDVNITIVDYDNLEESGIDHLQTVLLGHAIDAGDIETVDEIIKTIGD